MTDDLLLSNEPPNPVAQADRVFAAARKIEQGPGYYPTHLGRCIGPLSDAKCRCGISDLLFAIRAYDKAINDMAEAMGHE